VCVCVCVCSVCVLSSTLAVGRRFNEDFPLLSPPRYGVSVLMKSLSLSLSLSPSLFLFLSHSHPPGSQRYRDRKCDDVTESVMIPL
jgi:hypothetical protein